MMTPEEAVQKLRLIAGWADGDPEAAHSAADDVLLVLAPPSVRDAYLDVARACSWWAFA